MKKIIRILFLLLIPFLFASCIDYVQTMSYKNGKYQMYYKVTFSKLLFAMASKNPDELVKDLEKNNMENFPPNVMVKAVDTDLEIGFEASFSIDPRTTDETEKSFLPKIASNKYYVPFLLGSGKSALSDSSGSTTGSGSGMEEAFLSSAKCRIMIAKNIIPNIGTAYFEGVGTQDYTIPTFDYGDSYCLEIPFIILFSTEFYKTNTIIIEKN